MGNNRKLLDKEVTILERNGCTAENWSLIEVSKEFEASRVRFSRFSGNVVIGNNTGCVNIDGVERRCEISHVILSNCRIGDNVFIMDVSSCIHNYTIEDDVVIEDVSILMSEEGAFFGYGVKVKVMNETGGREVTLFNDLNAQIAYLQAMYRHDGVFQEKLNGIIQKAVDQDISEGAIIGRGAVVRNCGSIRNVRIGAYARVQGALELRNGTILSCVEHKTLIGSGVIISDFIIAEGAEVTSGALLERVYVGQGTLAGKQVSAENSFFFANSEAFHSEICSVFAGPYTVSHHKSTLLIASLWSFFNAGSGTNQSNHMYKLGPVHQGVFERGCKTGSFAYTMLESHIAAFCVIIGKHMMNIDIPFFPFSYLIEDGGRSGLMPGINLFSIGTVRDDEKWPARDRRKAPNKRDFITFDVFSPYTVEKMRRGRDILNDLYEKTPREEDSVHYGGVQIKRLMLRKGVKYYTMAIDRYLIDRVIGVVEDAGSRAKSWSEVLSNFFRPQKIKKPKSWVDIGGCITPRERVEVIVSDVREGRIRKTGELIVKLEQIHQSYHEDELLYVLCAFEEEYGFSPVSMSVQDANELVVKWESAARSLCSLTVENMKSEFSEASMISYGVDQETENRQRDFIAVRGTFQTNAVTKKVMDMKEGLKHRAEKMKGLINKFR